MQPRLINNQFSNLQTSFLFYKAALRSIHQCFVDKEFGEDVLKAILQTELAFNYAVVRYFFHYYQSLHNHYGVPVKLDWSEYFNYFDLLDTVIFNYYDQEEVEKNREVITKECTTAELGEHYVIYKSAEKLYKISERILIELYWQQFSVNHYANLGSEVLQADEFMPDTMFYLFCFKNKEQEIINDYVGLDVQNQNFKDSAQLYFTAAMDHCRQMYHNYGERIEEILHTIWNSSYADRLTVNKTIKDAQLANVAEEMPHYNPNFSDYFTLWECLTFWWQSQRVQEAGPSNKATTFCSKNHIDKMLTLAGAESDSNLAADIVELYSLLMPIEAITTEYICLQYYAETGIKANYAAYAKDITNGTRQYLSLLRIETQI